MACVAALDLGDRRVGLALWDDPDLSARPVGSLVVKADTLVAQVVAWLRAHDVVHVIIGLPLRLDGRQGLAATKARRTAQLIEKSSGVTIAFEDERLSTAQVYASSRAAGRSEKDTRTQVDALAAALLLDTWVQRVGPVEALGRLRGTPRGSE